VVSCASSELSQPTQRLIWRTRCSPARTAVMNSRSWWPMTRTRHTQGMVNDRPKGAGSFKGDRKNVPDGGHCRTAATMCRSPLRHSSSVAFRVGRANPTQYLLYSMSCSSDLAEGEKPGSNILRFPEQIRQFLMTARALKSISSQRWAFPATRSSCRGLARVG
jgi:hypothetical protein